MKKISIIILALSTITQPLAMANDYSVKPQIECKNGANKVSIFLTQDNNLYANLSYRNVHVKNMSCEQKAKLNYQCKGSGFSVSLLKKFGDMAVTGGSVDFYGEQNGNENIWFVCTHFSKETI